MAHKPEERSAASETMIVSGTAVVIAAGLFEWLVISPEHPGHALLSVIASSLAATVVMALLA
jgi:hypothetical protein